MVTKVTDRGRHPLPGRLSKERERLRRRSLECAACVFTRGRPFVTGEEERWRTGEVEERWRTGEVEERRGGGEERWRRGEVEDWRGESRRKVRLLF